MNKKLDFSEKALQDSLHLFLDLANQDSIPSEMRLDYTKKAFEIIINQENDSMHRVYLFRVANRYFNLSDPDRYGMVTKIIVKESDSENDTTALAKAYDYLGDYYKTPDKIDSSFVCFWKAERLYRKLNDQSKIGYIYGKIAGVYASVGDNANTELYSIKALKTLKGSNDKNSIFESYNELGNVYADRGEFQKALEYYNRALEIANLNEIPSVFHPKVTIFNNIGVVYQSLNNHEKAKSFFKKGLEEKNLFIHKANAYGMLLGNLALSEFKLRDYSNLPESYYKALKIRDSVKNYEGVVFNKIHLSEYFAEMKDTLKSQKFAQEALSLAKEIRKSKVILICFTQLADIEPPKASFYKQEYIKLNDSLHLEERKIQDKFARIEFETDEVILEKDMAILQKWTVFWIAVSVLLTGMIFYAFRIRQSRHRELLLLQSQQKANEEIYSLIVDQQQKFDQGREKEKKRIARELHDGTINRLSVIRASLSLLEKKTDPETIRHCIGQVAQIQEVEKEVRDIAHDLNRNAFSPKRGYPELLESAVAELAGTASLRIDLDIDSTIDWEAVDGQKKKNIYHILRQCLHYIKEHAQAAEARIRFLKNNSLLEIEICDDSIGLKDDDYTKSQGLRDIRSAAEEIGGNLKTSTALGEGLSIKITIPLKTDPDQKNRL